MPKDGLALIIASGRKKRGRDKEMEEVFGEESPDSYEEDEEGDSEGCDACLDQAWAAQERGSRDAWKSAMMSLLAAHKMGA
jgi:hypothetical protein